MENNLREKLSGIFDLITKERQYQIDTRGVERDRTKNMPNDWISYINHYATRWLPGPPAPYSRKAVQAFKESMVKVATIAVAAIEETDRILLDGFNSRPDILDPDSEFETSNINENNTNNIPLAIVASNLRDRGFEVKFMTAPVAMYRNTPVHAASYAWDQDYSIFDIHEGKIIFLYCLVNENGPLPNHCNDVGAATRIRFAVL